MTHALKEKSGPAPKAGVTPNMYIAHCGVESKTIDGMTAWWSQVDCIPCVAHTVRKVAEQGGQVQFVLPDA